MSKSINNTSLPAFSIIESVVGMAITAIIMGIIFVIFTIVSERLIDYKNQNQFINDMNRLTYSLNKDIFENEKMTVIENEIVFNGYSGERVKYLFAENYLLRNTSTFIDTFQIKLKQFRVDTVQNPSKTIVFQNLKLQVEVNKSDMDLKFYKPIFANELLQTIKE